MPDDLIQLSQSDALRYRRAMLEARIKPPPISQTCLAELDGHLHELFRLLQKGDAATIVAKAARILDRQCCYIMNGDGNITVGLIVTRGRPEDWRKEFNEHGTLGRGRFDQIDFLEEPAQKTLQLVFDALASVASDGQRTPRQLREQAERLGNALEDYLYLRGFPTEAVDDGKPEKREQGPANQIDPATLKDREKEILIACLRCKAVSRHHRVSRDRAAREADAQGPKSSYYKSIPPLVEMGLLARQKATGGGIWLTLEGISAAQALQHQKAKSA